MEELSYPVDVNAMHTLDKLTHEHAKEHKTSKLTDTPQAIESSKDSPMINMERVELIVLNPLQNQLSKLLILER